MSKKEDKYEQQTRANKLKENARFIINGTKKTSAKKLIIAIIATFVVCMVLTALQWAGVIGKYVLLIVLLIAMAVILIMYSIVKMKNRL